MIEMEQCENEHRDGLLFGSTVARFSTTTVNNALPSTSEVYPREAADGDILYRYKLEFNPDEYAKFFMSETYTPEEGRIVNYLLLKEEDAREEEYVQFVEECLPHARNKDWEIYFPNNVPNDLLDSSIGQVHVNVLFMHNVKVKLDEDAEVIKQSRQLHWLTLPATPSSNTWMEVLLDQVPNRTSNLGQDNPNSNQGTSPDITAYHMSGNNDLSVIHPHVCDSRQRDGLLFGARVASFTTTLFHGGFPTISQYPRSTEPGDDCFRYVFDFNPDLYDKFHMAETDRNGYTQRHYLLLSKTSPREQVVMRMLQSCIAERRDDRWELSFPHGVPNDCTIVRMFVNVMFWSSVSVQASGSAPKMHDAFILEPIQRTRSWLDEIIQQKLGLEEVFGLMNV